MASKVQKKELSTFKATFIHWGTKEIKAVNAMQAAEIARTLKKDDIEWADENEKYGIELDSVMIKDEE